MKDWKIIFNTKSFYFIFIKHLKNSDYLSYYFLNKDEIKKEDSFFIIMPDSVEETHHPDSSFFIKKYAFLLKEFMESNKRTLISEETIIKHLIKDDKLNNFFKILIKKKKNIVLFCNDNIDSFGNQEENLFVYMSKEDLLLQENLFRKFNDIKESIKKTYNPFKNPFYAFEKIQEEKLN